MLLRISRLIRKNLCMLTKDCFALLGFRFSRFLCPKQAHSHIFLRPNSGALESS